MMCEFYLHGFFHFAIAKFLPNLFLGEVQLKAFALVTLSQVKWKKELDLFQRRVAEDDLPMKMEIFYSRTLVADFKNLVKKIYVLKCLSKFYHKTRHIFFIS